MKFITIRGVNRAMGHWEKGLIFIWPSFLRSDRNSKLAGVAHAPGVA